MADPELISIIDCELCREIPSSDRAARWGPPPDEPPLPPSWGSLSTVAVLAPGFGWTWGDRDELRMCPSCGTYYEYRQVYDDGDLFRAEGTEWYLARLTPRRAAERQRRAQPPQAGSEPGNAERRYPSLIQALRTDLGRVQKEASLAVKQYVVEALTEHDRQASDWDTLKTTLLDHPDPAVRVASACPLLWTVLRVLDDGKRILRDELASATFRLLTKERRESLIAVLAEGLSHDEKMAAPPGDEPARTDSMALSMLRRCGPYMSLAVALPALAAWLAGGDTWRRKAARDFLLTYVAKPWRFSQGPRTLELRARDVLSSVSVLDTEEALAVAGHCRTVLALPTEPTRGPGAPPR